MMSAPGLKKRIKDPHVFLIFQDGLAFRSFEDHRVATEPGIVLKQSKSFALASLPAPGVGRNKQGIIYGIPAAFILMFYIRMLAFGYLTA